jgi:hypothetical protein
MAHDGFVRIIITAAGVNVCSKRTERAVTALMRRLGGRATDASDKDVTVSFDDPKVIPEFIAEATRLGAIIQ